MKVIAEFPDFAVLEDANGRFVFYASGDIEDWVEH